MTNTKTTKKITAKKAAPKKAAVKKAEVAKIENLFPFEYDETILNNVDGSASRFSVVYGEEGKIVHTKKKSYHIVKTEEFSKLGIAFKKQGYDVQPFTHNSGEVISYQINLGEKKTQVGDISYKGIINMPNNGGGVGRLSIVEERLICTNGIARKYNNLVNDLRIPHKIDYPAAIKLMTEGVQAFVTLVDKAIEVDESLNAEKLTKEEIQLQLAEWFYTYEIKNSRQKPESLEQFRKEVYGADSEDESSPRWLALYEELREAFNREISNNKELKLKFSRYTVFATITNYLSRKKEKRSSVVHTSRRLQRDTKKLRKMFAI